MGVEFEIEATVRLCKRGEAAVLSGGPFDLKGYKSDTLFKVVDCCTMWDGKLVWLLEDDNTDSPAFTDGVDYEYFYLDEELEVVVTSTIKPAQSDLPDGWIPNEGKEPRFMIDGGSVDVLFNDDRILYQVTDRDRGGINGHGCLSANIWTLHPDSISAVKAWRPSITVGDTPKQVETASIEVIRTSTYTVKIKGLEFTLTEDEYYDLRAKLEDVE